MAAGGLKPKPALCDCDHRFDDADVGSDRLLECGGLGDPEDEGVYASNPAKES
jgi:hypothetical protein